MKFQIGDRIKEKTTSETDHDDFQIMSTFTSDKLNGYIVVNLYTNTVTAIEQNDLEKICKLSYRAEEKADYIGLFDFLKDRYSSVKNQVINNPQSPNPVFNEWEEH